jgi:cation diffusion facilitator family transporter
MSTERRSLVGYAWLSIGAAIVIIAMKGFAYWVTSSVGLLSDALESLVNLVAACVALVTLTIAARPADEDHPYGHGKAEYFSSGVEGALILVAAVAIAVAAGERLLHDRPLDNLGIGIGIAVLASVVNLVVARILLQAGHRYHSIALEADARHLMTDVWTTVGVVVGVGAAALTGWRWLDAIVALAVAVNIVATGVGLLRRSALGLMDTALPEADQAAVRAILDRYRSDEVQYHALRTRQGAARRFIDVHVLVPGAWTVQRGHDLLERIEAEIRARLANAEIVIHLEPIEDPASWDDPVAGRS